MQHHKITCEKDLIKLQEIYEDDSIFEVLESKEELTLPDLRFFGDWENYTPITIQHI